MSEVGINHYINTVKGGGPAFTVNNAVNDVDITPNTLPQDFSMQADFLILILERMYLLKQSEYNYPIVSGTVIMQAQVLRSREYI